MKDTQNIPEKPPRRTRRIERKTNALRELNNEIERNRELTAENEPAQKPSKMIMFCRVVIWTVGIPIALGFAFVVVNSQFEYWKKAFGPNSEIMPGLDLAVATPTVFEGLAWVFTILALVAVVASRPSGTYERLMWGFSAFAAVVNASHNLSMGQWTAGLILGAFSFFGPLIVHFVLRLDRDLQSTSTLSELKLDNARAIFEALRTAGQVVFHPWHTRRALVWWTDRLYPSWDLAYRAARIGATANAAWTAAVDAQFFDAIHRSRRPTVVHVSLPPAGLAQDEEAPQDGAAALPVEPAPAVTGVPPILSTGVTASSVLTTAPDDGPLSPEVEEMLRALNDPATWSAAQAAHDTAQEDCAAEGAQPLCSAQDEVRSPAHDAAQQGAQAPAQDGAQPDGESCAADAQGEIGDCAAEVAQGCAGTVSSDYGGAQQPAHDEVRTAQQDQQEAAQPVAQDGAQLTGASGAQPAQEAAQPPVRSPRKASAHRDEKPSRTGAQQGAQGVEGTAAGQLSARAVAMFGIEQLHESGTDPRTLTVAELARQIEASRDTARRALGDWCAEHGLPKDPAKDNSAQHREA